MSLEPLELMGPANLIRELSSRGVIAYRREELQAALKRLAGRAIPASRLITATVGLGEVGAAFAALGAPGNEHLKVLIAPT